MAAIAARFSRAAALCLLAAVALLALLSGASAQNADMNTCAKLVNSMGGGKGISSMAPQCNTQGGSFSTGACCGQIKALLNASGPLGQKCMCNAQVFNTFSAQVKIPGFSNSAIPFFMSQVCKIPIAGRGC